MIGLEWISNSLYIDVTFFGYPSWNTVLTCNKPIEIKDDKGENIDGIRFVLDFNDLNDRKKFIGLKKQCSSKYDYIYVKI